MHHPQSYPTTAHHHLVSCGSLLLLAGLLLIEVFTQMGVMESCGTFPTKSADDDKGFRAV